MKDDAAGSKQEIVIVRARGGDDMAAGKGGAWKIAYADFVTAMMAFFLVMWLINASNEETRAQVASYFNPIKLTDSSTGTRGLKDKMESRDGQHGKAEATAGRISSLTADTRQESEALADPHKLLARIEETMEVTSKTPAFAPSLHENMFASPKAGQTGDGISDPFDPLSWERAQPHSADIARDPEVAKSDGKGPQLGPGVSPKSGKKGQTDARASPTTRKPVNEVLPQEREAAAERQIVKEANAKVGARSTALGANETRERAEVLKAEISARLGTALDRLPESIDVKSTDEGLLISLTDRQTFGMFRTGSAVPEPELIKLVEAIAGVLANRSGYVVIRGHTDALPYRNKKYDNWQLSTARAHLTQYMLVRGGLDERRIRRIEGLADRDLKIKDDPQAPENRRIEILLGGESP